MHWSVPARRLLAVALLLVAAACNGDDDGGSSAPPPSTTASTTTPTDPYAVPAVIDEAYVNRVLAALDQVEGDAVRTLVTTRMVGAEAVKRLRAVYNDPQFQEERDGLIRSLATDLSEYKNPPGNRRTTVLRLVTRDPNCILAEVNKDFSDVVRSSPPKPADEVDILTLRPTQGDGDPDNLNPTPWSIGNAEVVKVGQLPARARCPG